MKGMKETATENESLEAERESILPVLRVNNRIKYAFGCSHVFSVWNAHFNGISSIYALFIVHALHIKMHLFSLFHLSDVGVCVCVLKSSASCVLSFPLKPTQLLASKYGYLSSLIPHLIWFGNCILWSKPFFDRIIFVFSHSVYRLEIVLSRSLSLSLLMFVYCEWQFMSLKYTAIGNSKPFQKRYDFWFYNKDALYRTNRFSLCCSFSTLPNIPKHWMQY